MKHEIDEVLNAVADGQVDEQTGMQLVSQLVSISLQVKQVLRGKASVTTTPAQTTANDSLTQSTAVNDSLTARPASTVAPDQTPSPTDEPARHPDGTAVQPGESPVSQTADATKEPTPPNDTAVAI